MRGVCVACLIGKQKKPILLENGLERLQALALFGVPQDDPLVTPAARENLTVGRKGDRPDLTAAIFSNVREHICNGRLRLSPPLRLSPGEGGKDATLGKMQSPVALELLELLARSHIPQPDAVVVFECTPAARSEHGAVERESDVVDLGTVLVL